MNKKLNFKLKKNNFFLKNLKYKNIKDNYFMWFSKVEKNKFIKSSYKSRKEIEIDIKKQINDKNNFFLGIYNLKKKHIGNIKFNDFDIKNNSAWLGILIG